MSHPPGSMWDDIQSLDWDSDSDLVLIGDTLSVATRQQLIATETAAFDEELESLESKDLRIMLFKAYTTGYKSLNEMTDDEIRKAILERLE